MALCHGVPDSRENELCVVGKKVAPMRVKGNDILKQQTHAPRQVEIVLVIWASMKMKIDK